MKAGHAMKAEKRLEEVQAGRWEVMAEVCMGRGFDCDCC